MYGIVLTNSADDEYDETDMFSPINDENIAYDRFLAVVQAFRVTEWVGCVNLIQFDVDKDNITNSKVILAMTLY